MCKTWIFLTFAEIFIDMDEIFEFLYGVQHNNNREWFIAHKDLYKRAEARANELALQLIDGISAFDTSCNGLTVKDCPYRIYRDLRFSPDKRPYKTHIGIYVCPGGKKSQLAGYYFHLQPDNEDYLDGCLISAGMYDPSKDMLKTLRDEIMFDGKRFVEALSKAKNFVFFESSKMARVPLGYPKGHPYAELLKLRNFAIAQPISKKRLQSNDLVKWALDEFHTAYDFNSLLNDIVTFREN